jgi:hypothetical protein
MEKNCIVDSLTDEMQLENKLDDQAKHYTCLNDYWANLQVGSDLLANTSTSSEMVLALRFIDFIDEKN